MKDVKRASQVSADAEECIGLRRHSLYKSQAPAVVAFIHNRVFGADALFIRSKNTAGARERATALIRRGDI
jgi:hypothetical protein